jgi:hypothetical protein
VDGHLPNDSTRSWRRADAICGKRRSIARH